MLDRDHALSGALAGTGLVTLSHFAPIPSVLLIVSTAGAACIPDLDEPGSAVADTFRGASRALASGVKRLAHGHRRGTHTLLSALIVSGVIGGVVILSPIALAVLTAILTAVALRCAAPSHYRRDLAILIIAAVAGFLSVTHPVPAVPLVLSFATGYTLHLAGDVVTASGAPLLLPFSDQKASVPLLGRVGSQREKIAGAVMIAALALAVWGTFHGLLPSGLHGVRS